MNDTDQRSDFERRISLELQASISDWTPECLDPLDLLRLVDDTATDSAIQAMRSHTATCAYCRREYVQLREALVEAEQLRATSQKQVPIITSSEKQKSELTASTVPVLLDTENNRTAGIILWWKSLLLPRAVAAYALVGTCVLMLAYLGGVRPLQIQNYQLRHSTEGANTISDLKLQLVREQAAYLKEKEGRAQEHQDATKQMADLKRVNLHHNEEMKKLAVLLDKSGKIPGVLVSKNDESILQVDKRQMEELKVRSSLAGDNDSTASLLKQITGLNPQGTRIEAPPQGLRWDPVPDVDFYKVSLLPIYADGHSGAFVIQERKVAEAKLPLTDRLKYGQAYEWQVDAYKSQEDTVPISRGTARFAVLEHSQMEKTSSLHLQLGTLYLKTGLIGEAIQEWQAIPIESSQYKRAQMHLNTPKSTAFKH